MSNAAAIDTLGGDGGDAAPPDPALFSGGARKKKRKAREQEEYSGLGITSLMDALTIILVFLLKNFSNNPVQLKDSKDLKLPASTAQEMPADTTAMTLTLKHILVDDDMALELEDGKVPQRMLSGGDLMIDPLFELLQESVTLQKRVASINKKAVFTGTITVVADRHVPLRLLRQAMYTAGQAEFGKFKFAVVRYKE